MDGGGLAGRDPLDLSHRNRGGREGQHLAAGDGLTVHGDHRVRQLAPNRTCWSRLMRRCCRRWSDVDLER